MFRNIRIATACAALTATSAVAGSFEGGTVGLASYDAGGGDYTANELSGSVVFRLNDRLLLQGDFTRIDEFSEDNYGVHLVFAPAPGTALGAFYNHEQFPGLGFDQLGSEVKLPLELGGRSLALSAFLSTETDNGGLGTTFNYAAVSVASEIAPQLSLNGTLGSVSGNSDVNVLSGALRYDTAKGIYAEAIYTVTSGDFDDHSIGIKLGYDFGSGAVFDNRTWAALFHGL